MRAIDPRRRAAHVHNNRRSRKPFFGLLALILVAFAAGGLIYSKHASSSKDQTTNQMVVVNQNIPTVAKKGTLKHFTGEQFKQLYNNFAYPNTAQISEDTPITGNVAADTKIREIAAQRGYKLRSAPVTDAFQDIGDGFKLQQRAAQPWLDLKAAAKKDGINLGLTAAYRSADDQRQLFLTRLAAANIPVASIASGTYDSQISTVLAMTAIPGYSRHHTGYTIDIACQDQPTVSFQFTNCFDWLNKNNYEMPKTNGWIPSYPEEAQQQGPDPETWEYVWVGKDAVTE